MHMTSLPPRFNRVILLIPWIQSPVGRPRSCIAFRDFAVFPISIGAYKTILRAPCGKAINRTFSKYLDVVHLNIAFGDVMSVGGFKYALIFVDKVARFNWCFGLKSLSHDNIIAAFLAFLLLYTTAASLSLAAMMVQLPLLSLTLQEHRLQ